MLTINTKDHITQSAPALSQVAQIIKSNGLNGGEGVMKLSTDFATAVFERTTIASRAEVELRVVRRSDWNVKNYETIAYSLAEKHDIVFSEMNKEFKRFIQKFWNVSSWTQITQLAIPSGNNVRADRLNRVLPERVGRAVHTLTPKYPFFKTLAPTIDCESEVRAFFRDILEDVVCYYFRQLGLLEGDIRETSVETRVSFLPDIKDYMNILDMKVFRDSVNSLASLPIEPLRKMMTAERSTAFDGAKQPTPSVRMDIYVNSAEMVAAFVRHLPEFNNTYRANVKSEEAIGTLYSLCLSHWVPSKTTVIHDDPSLTEHEVVQINSRDLAFFLAYDPQFLTKSFKVPPRASRIKNIILPFIKSAMAESSYYVQVPDLASAVSHLHHVVSRDSYNRPHSIALAESIDTTEGSVVFAAESVPTVMGHKGLYQFIRNDAITTQVDATVKAVSSVLRPEKVLVETVEAHRDFIDSKRKEDSFSDFMLPFLGAHVGFATGRSVTAIREGVLEAMATTSVHDHGTLRSSLGMDALEWKNHVKCLHYYYALMVHYIISRPQVSCDFHHVVSIKDKTSNVALNASRKKFPILGLSFSVSNVLPRFPLSYDQIINGTMTTTEPMHVIPYLDSRPHLTSIKAPVIDIDAAIRAEVSDGGMIYHSDWWRSFVIRPRFQVPVSIESTDPETGSRIVLQANPDLVDVFTASWDKATYARVSHAEVAQWRQAVYNRLSLINDYRGKAQTFSVVENRVHYDAKAESAILLLAIDIMGLCDTPIGSDWMASARAILDANDQIRKHPYLARARTRIESQISMKLAAGYFVLANLGVGTSLLGRVVKMINDPIIRKRILITMSAATKINEKKTD